MPHTSGRKVPVPHVLISSAKVKKVMEKLLNSKEDRLVQTMKREEVGVIKLREKVRMLQDGLMASQGEKSELRQQVCPCGCVVPAAIPFCTIRLDHLPSIPSQVVHSRSPNFLYSDDHVWGHGMASALRYWRLRSCCHLTLPVTRAVICWLGDVGMGLSAPPCPSSPPPLSSGG